MARILSNHSAKFSTLNFIVWNKVRKPGEHETSAKILQHEASLRWIRSGNARSHAKVEKLRT
jgi:hypothetical protein